jgi:hypothetical protein
MGLNPGRRGGKQATNRLSYGAVFTAIKKVIRFFVHSFASLF